MKLANLFRNCAKIKRLPILHAIYKESASAAPPPKLSRIGIFVKSLFGKYLLLTNTICTGLLMSAGDGLLQYFESKRATTNKTFDVRRSGEMFVIGALTGPPQHYYYHWLEHVLPSILPMDAVKKIAIDQLIFSPVCVVAFLFAACLVLGQANDCVVEVQETFLDVYKVVEAAAVYFK